MSNTLPQLQNLSFDSLRYRAIALVTLGALSLSLAACGGSEEDPTSAPTVATSATPSPEGNPTAIVSPTPAQPTEAAPSSSTPSAPVPTTEPKQKKYPKHTKIVATVFNIGEPASPENDFTSNEDLAWTCGKNDDGEFIAVDMFGGVDDPENRDKNGMPADFKPKKNPNYAALPVDEFDDNGELVVVKSKTTREWSHWPKRVDEDDYDHSAVEGQDILVSRKMPNGKLRQVVVQWIDTGPKSEGTKVAKDVKYVFGDDDKRPSNNFGLKAGIDLSPKAADDLGFGVYEGSAVVDWQFIDKKDIPKNLQTKYNTSEKYRWDNKIRCE